MTLVHDVTVSIWRNAPLGRGAGLVKEQGWVALRLIERARAG